MTIDELKTIFTRLKDQTSRKEIKWKPKSSDSLRIDFPRSSIIFYKNAGYTPYLSILNSAGNEVAKISKDSFGTAPETAEQLRHMWNAAHTIAYEIDETVQDILSKLGSK